MPFQGNGTYAAPASTWNPAITNTPINSTDWIALLADLSTALSTTLTKDGQSTPTANITLGGFKITNLAAGTAVSDAPRVSQVQNSSFTSLTAVAGTNTITATATPTPAAYVVGQVFDGIAANTNTGATTFNLSSLGAGAVQLAGTALTGGEIVANSPFRLIVSAATPVFQLVANGQVSVPAGAISDYAGSTVPAGWLECDGSAISRTTYSRLFTAISTTWGAGDTSTTFNLPDFRSKARIGRGTGTSTESFTNTAINTGTDTITVTSNATKWVTGMQISWGVSGTPPTTNPANLLDNADTVFVIRTGLTTIKVATTLANAQNGTAIDITNAGSGTFTMTATYTARTLGEYGGEETHAMSSTEALAHIHTSNDYNGTNLTGGGGSQPGTNPLQSNTSSTGGNAAMNIMTPYAVTMTIIKT